jgi:uncharacterized membrane protein
MSAIALKAWLPPPTSSAVPAATQKNKHYENDDEKCHGVHVALPMNLCKEKKSSGSAPRLPLPRTGWEFIAAATASQLSAATRAKAGLHFTFGALAVASHFIPAFSQAD